MCTCAHKCTSHLHLTNFHSTHHTLPFPFTFVYLLLYYNFPKFMCNVAHLVLFVPLRFSHRGRKSSRYLPPPNLHIHRYVPKKRRGEISAMVSNRVPSRPRWLCSASSSISSMPVLPTRTTACPRTIGSIQSTLYDARTFFPDIVVKKCVFYR